MWNAKKTAIALGALVWSVSGNAIAASKIIEDAKDACIIGEQSDGYLGFVEGSNSATSAVRREVRDVNQQRKAVYNQLAERNGVTIEVTAALTAEKLIKQAQVGECVRLQNGKWQRK